MAERVCTEKSCTCKKFVTGPRCDACLDGYWDLSEKNGDNGCKSNPKCLKLLKNLLFDIY